MTTVATALIAMLTISLPASANDYLIEAIIFSWNDSPAPDDGEVWRVPGRESLQMPDIGEALTDNPAVQSESRLLDREVERLSARGDVTVLDRRTWTQLRADRKGSPKVDFKTAADNQFDLSGWLRVYDNTPLLYAEIDLAMTDPNAVQNTVNNLAQKSSQNGVSVITDTNGNVTFSNRNTPDSGINQRLNSTFGITYRLKERRRLKFNEIHYIDHPKFGVILSMTRNPSP